MTWVDITTLAGLLLLCAIAFGVYRVKQTIDRMYSGLGQLLAHNLEIAKKILQQLDNSGAFEEQSHPTYSLRVELRSIRESLRHLTSRWERLHMPEFAREYAKEKMERIERGKKERREERDRKAKKSDAPENGGS